MIEKISYEGNIEKVKVNKNFREIIKESKESEDVYIIGIDVASKNIKDYSILSRFIKNEDGTWTFKDYKTL